MSAPVDVFAIHRDALRAAGFVINPWRLGVEVGKAYASRPHDAPPSPYPAPISCRRYNDGVQTGIRQARQEAREGGAK